MDMAFINALNASDHFPPHDPWMSGETLNYYYLGHLAMAWPIQLLGLRPDSGYLLGLGAAGGADRDRGLHVLGHAVGGGARRRSASAPPRGGPVFAGLVSAALVAILGNLAGVRTWLRAADPPGDYAWFEPSRVIPDTINEFPSFSFVLGDLHAHVLALPFTVLALAFAMQVALSGPRGDLLWRAVAEAFAAALAVGTLYAINAWSYPVAAGVLAAAVVVWLRNGGPRGFPLVWLGLVLVASFVLILPFVLDFDPESRGIGVVETRRRFARLAGRHDADLRHPRCSRSSAIFVDRVRRSPNRWRWIGWGGVAARGGRVAAGLVGPDRRDAASGSRRRSAINAALAPALSGPERFLWVLIAGGAALLLIPELFFLRDAFEGQPEKRMNTVFKAGFQAYLLLGLAAGVRAAVGRCVAAAAGDLERVGGGRRDPAAARARLPVRGQLRPHRRLRQRPDAERAAVAGGRARRAIRARSPGCATTRPATRSCWRRSATTTRRSGTRGSPRSAAGRR